MADGPIGEAIAHIRKAAHAAGKVAGAHGTQTGYAVQMLTEGFNFMTPTADFRALQMGMAATLSGIRDKAGGEVQGLFDERDREAALLSNLDTRLQELEAEASEGRHRLEL